MIGFVSQKGKNLFIRWNLSNGVLGVVVYSKEWARAILRSAFEDTGVTAEQAALLALLSEEALRPKRKPFWHKLFTW